MSSAKASVPQNRKRRLSEAGLETDSSPHPRPNSKSSKNTDDSGHRVPFGTTFHGSGSLVELSENLIEGQSGLLPRYRPIGLARKTSTLRSLNALHDTADQVLVTSEA